MRIRPLISLLALAAIPFTSWGEKVTNVEGEAIFYGESNDSPAQCRRQALDMARTDALGKAFGWNLQGAVYMNETINNLDENSYFSSTNSMNVNGEWISDTDVKYQYDLDENGNLIVRCWVKGSARKISNETVDFEALTLRSGKNRDFVNDVFNSGDPMYLLINTPVDGYMVAYLVDDTQQAYCLLPYKNSTEQAMQLKRGKDYVFFDPDDSDSSLGASESARLVTDARVERDELIVVFSPNYFNKAQDADTANRLPRILPLADLNKWLLNVHKNDPKLSIKRIPIVIKGK